MSSLWNKQSSFDRAFVRLASSDPALKAALQHLVKEAAPWGKLPKGWTQDSVEKFWSSLTGEAKHKVTKCIERMSDKMDDPGAFCASLADKVDPGWRSRKKAAATYRYYFTVLGRGDAPRWAVRPELEKAVKRLGWDRVEIHDEAHDDDDVLASASRVAARWTVSNIDRLALNKYNVPEILSLLLKAMEVGGLSETVQKLKQMGFTRLINDAWQNRGDAEVMQ